MSVGSSSRREMVLVWDSCLGIRIVGGVFTFGCRFYLEAFLASCFKEARLRADDGAVDRPVSGCGGDGYV